MLSSPVFAKPHFRSVSSPPLLRVLRELCVKNYSPLRPGLNAVNVTFPQSWNRYAYVLNNPATDPLQQASLPSSEASAGSQTATGGTVCMDDECLETAEVDRTAIPWAELAFRSTHEALRDYLKGIRHPIPI